MNQLGLDQVIDKAAQALRDGNIQLAEQLIFPALDQKPDIAALFFYAGTICAQKGQHALGLLCLQRSYELDPHPAIFANGAACLREMQQIGQTRAMLHMGVEHAPWDPHIRANLCGSYVQDGNPWPGIEAGQGVVDHPEVGPAAKFNLALLNLEAGNLAEGFRLYGVGHHRFREDRKYTPDPPALTPELHGELRGTDKRLLIYGEQGLGDELMFATMLAAVRHDYDIVFDHHPRLEWLHCNSVFRDLADFIPKRKVRDSGLSSKDCHAKVAIGNLCQFYRTDAEDFPPGPFYSAPRELAAAYRERLLKAAEGRKIVGIATRGGLMHTGRLYRMMPMPMIERILADESCMFVNLDYEDMTQLCEWTQDKFGANKLLWFPSINWHWQYEQTAALVAATDAVVTVPQTVAHLSAGMGHPTYVMTSSKPDWRMGLTDESWYWYNSPQVRLLRQQGDSWEPALARLSELLQQSSAEPNFGCPEPPWKPSDDDDGYENTCGGPGSPLGRKVQSQVQDSPRNSEEVVRIQMMAGSIDFGDDGKNYVAAPVNACPLREHEVELLKGIAGKSMCELGAKSNRVGTYKQWFEGAGYSHVSMDLNGMHGSLRWDLQEHIDLEAIGSIGGPFDVVTNFGTTEHVDDQVACWRNVHALLKVGGVLISTTPVDWPNHGRWYPTEDWWEEFCESNGYEVLRAMIAEYAPERKLLCVAAKKREDLPFVFPSAPMTDMQGGRVGSYETEKLINIRSA